jgi:tetratricopeptide (TPR) repeat protein
MKNKFTYKELKKILKQRKKGEIHIENEFLRDAVEGYEIFPNSLKQFPKLLRKALKKQGFKPRFFHPFLSISIFTIISIGLFFFNGELQEERESLHTAKKKQEKIIQISEYKDINLINIDKNNKSTPSPKTIFQLKKKNHKDMITSIPLSNCSISMSPDSCLDNKRHKIIYLGDFKCIDYRYPKNNLPTKPLAAFPGLDPMHENYERQNALPEDIIEWEIIAYKDYLIIAFDYLQKQQYDKALSFFKNIQHQYPSDLNALFYSAYTYYLKEEYGKALTLFKSISEQDKGYFDQEALWYVALCYEKLGYFEEAKQIFIKISEEKAFYSEVASQKINQNQDKIHNKP